MRICTLLALLHIAIVCAADPADGEASHGVILQYHHVADDTPAITSIPPARFAEQLEWLASQGYDIWPTEKLVDYVKQGKPTPDHVAAITFDDAYADIYTNAFPLLKKRGWPFTIFVATEFVEARSHQYLSWGQLAKMKAAGATIANHTHDHTHLLRRRPGETAEAWRRRVEGDITRAQALIRLHLIHAPMLFAYPYGEYDSELAAIIERMGYTGFGQQSGAIGPKSWFAVLPRFPMGGDYSEMESFVTKVQTLPLPIETITGDPVVGDAYPTLILKFTRTDLRLNQLACYGPDGRITVEQTSESTFVAKSEKPIPVGRSRYNCTMPARQSSRYYWFSQMWIRKEPDGSWYPEP